MSTLELKSPDTLFVALRLLKEADTNLGMPLRFDSGTSDIVGVLPVFRSRDSAERVYGIGVELQEIRMVV